MKNKRQPQRQGRKRGYSERQRPEMHYLCLRHFQAALAGGCIMFSGCPSVRCDCETGEHDILPPTKEEVNVFARVRLSVCLSVSKITQKRVHGFG